MSFTGVVLGLGGLLPFLATSIGLWWRDDERFLQVGLLYGAVILSFLGGLVWGAVSAAVAATGAPWSGEHSRLLVLSVVPALAGWGATFLAAPYPLLVMAVAVLAVLLVDRRLAAANIVPGWWMTLRWRLSAGVGALLLLAAAGV